MRRIAIAGLVALTATVFAQVATVGTASAATVAAIHGTLSPAIVTVGSGSSVINGSVDGDTISGVAPTGTVTIRVDDGSPQVVDLTPVDANTSTYPDVPLGNLALAGSPHTITATYSGDGTYDAAGPATLGSVTVNQATPTVTITPSGTNITVGTPTTVSGTVSGAVGTPSGTVTITDNGNQVASDGLNGSGNYATTAFTLGVGTHTLVAHYGGGGNYVAANSGNATVTVNAAAATINVTSTLSINYGAAYSLTGTVSGGAGQPTPSGSVSISAPSPGPGIPALSTAVQLSGSGGFTLALTLPFLKVGTHPLTITYNGDANYDPIAKPVQNLVVNKAQVTVVVTGPNQAYPGLTTPFTVTVTPATPPTLAGAALPTGNVSAPHASGNAPLSGNTAAVTINQLTQSSLEPFTYSGDGNYAQTAKQQQITFTKYALDIAVVDAGNCSSPAPSCANVPPGVPMSLRAVLTLHTADGQPTPPASFKPTGTIHFSDSRNNAFWTPQNPNLSTVSTWFAATIGQFPSAGQDNVSATYAGDANFQATNNTAAPLQVGVPNSDHFTRYIYWVYNDLLGRTPEAGGAAFWLGQLNAGVPRPAVATALVFSNEYRADVISDMYQQFLNRSTDAGGLNFWVNQVASGVTFESFQSMLISSPEYYSMPSKGNNDPATFVNSMYHDILGRSVDSGGRQYFLSLLAQGVPRSNVVAIVVLSREHLQTTVNGYYQHYLNRNADAGGVNFWVTQLQRGARDEDIVSLIIGSDEYFSLV